MRRLMDQMHRTDDRESHYQLMRQHWQEMNRVMGDLDRMPCGDDCTLQQYRERDRLMEQLREQMRLHQQEFEQREYRRGGMMR